jgi:hypothetical protein
MATNNDGNDKSPASTVSPDGSSEEFIPGPDSGLRNPPSAVERGLKEAADIMHEPKRPKARIEGIAGEKPR